MIEKAYKSIKSDSSFIARGEPKRAFLVVGGEAATKAKVMKEVERIRREGADFATVDWVARQFSRTY